MVNLDSVGKNDGDKESLKNKDDQKKDEKLCRVIWQVLLAAIACLHSYGSFVSITGSIISKLKDEPGEFKMTEDEETWFAYLFLEQ